MGTATLTQKNANRIMAAALLVALAATPQLALAQTLEPANNFATTVRDFMTGTFARTVAAIAVAFIGYRWFTGRMELGRALTIAGGIILVLGAVSIVEFIDSGI